MRRLKTDILVAVKVFTIAFALGVSVWKYQPLSLCTLTEYRSHYQLVKGDNYVNLKGYLYGGDTLYFSDTAQNGCKYDAAEVIIEDEGKLSDETRELIDELRRKTDISETLDSDHKFARAGVEIIGTLSEREDYCYKARYIIKALQIKPVTSLEIIDRQTLQNEFQKSRQK